jgi:phospholipid-binding lipoprotein MlaA
MFKFNEVVDAVTLKPIAQVYDAVLPNFAKKRIGNAYSNIDEVPAIINDVLQARIGWAIADFWRLFFNTTLGIGGLFDVATHFGLKGRRQDLGLTFARWGIKHSPYFIIPILGRSTVRDGVAQFLNYEFFTVYPYINPLGLRYSIWGLGKVNTRAELLPTDKLVKQAFDPYVFVRNAYLQHREHLIDPEQKEAADTYIEESAEHASS